MLAQDTRKAMKREATLAALFLVANLGVLGFFAWDQLGDQTPEGTEPVRAPDARGAGQGEHEGAPVIAAPGSTPGPDQGPRKAADPSSHLPLAGMDGFFGSKTDACLRLHGFMLNVNEIVAGAGGTPALGEEDLMQIVEETTCTLAEEPVIEALASLAASWSEAGQELISPFDMLDADYGDAEEILSAAEPHTPPGHGPGPEGARDEPPGGPPGPPGGPHHEPGQGPPSPREGPR